MYNAYIEGPTVEEAPDYVGGTDVRIKLTTDDGTVLLETTTSSFPQAANYHGMTSSGGTITMTYIVTSEPVIDERAIRFRERRRKRPSAEEWSLRWKDEGKDY